MPVPISQPTARNPRWDFRAAALVGIPVLVLVLVELGLRVMGFGYSPAFLLSRQVRGQDCWVENPRFGWRFFSPEAARTPRRTLIPKVKAPGTVRIVILGESAALGDPEPDFGFGRFLEAMLQARFPGRRIEVVNAAMTAINSHAIVPIARDCARLRADFWVIYMGNNEVVGPFGAGTVLGSQTPPLWMIRANLGFKATRLGQAFERASESVISRNTGAKAWRGMEMFVDHQVRREDPRMARVYSHFEANLRDIIEAGRRCGARLIVSTVASNLKDCAPFGSLHGEGLTGTRVTAWEESFKTGQDHEKAGRLKVAHDHYRKAEQNDSQFADLSFAIARCLQGLGQTNEARPYFVKARDNDTLRFRADSRLNDIIRQIVGQWANQDVFLLDAERELAREMHDGLLGNELFYEHVHFNMAGNYQLALLVGEQIAASLEQSKTESISNRWITQAECERHLGWTSLNQKDVWETMRSRNELPPFTRQLNHIQQCERINHELNQLEIQSAPTRVRQSILDLQQTMQQDSQDWARHLNLGKLLRRIGDRDRALNEIRKVIEWMPHHEEARFLEGSLLDELGRSNEAERALREAIRLQPLFPEAHNGLGLTLASQGRFADALVSYQEALRLKPDFSTAHINLGLALSRLGRTEEAKDHYRQAIRLKPESVGAYVNLGKLLRSEGQLAAAKSNYLEAIRIDPSNAIVHFNLGNVLVKMGQVQEGMNHYQTSLHLQPGFAEAHSNLGFEFARQGQSQEAIKHFAEAVRLDPNLAEAHLNLGVAYANQRRMDEAIQHFREALRIDPQDATARKYLDAALRAQQKN